MSNQLFETIQQLNLAPLLNRGVFGIEKEGQRIDGQGRLSALAHPDILGDRQFHPYIGTDFAETQTEIVSDQFDNTIEVEQQLSALEQVLQASLPGCDYLWPLSMPPVLPADETQIPLAHFTKDVQDYREYLAKRYGRRLQMVSGIHYNFSLDSTLLARLYGEYYHDQYAQLSDFSDALYLQLAQNYQQYRFVLTYLFGASPIAEAGFLKAGQSARDHPVRSLRASNCLGTPIIRLRLILNPYRHMSRRCKPRFKRDS